MEHISREARGGSEHISRPRAWRDVLGALEDASLLVLFGPRTPNVWYKTWQEELENEEADRIRLVVAVAFCLWAIETGDAPQDPLGATPHHSR